MKNKKEIGLDEWKLPVSMLHVLNVAGQHEIELYDVSEHASYTSCFVPVFQRYHMRHLFEQGILVKTTGMLGYCLRSLKKPYRVAGLLCAIALWYVMSHMIYEVNIKGSDAQSTALIKETLAQMEIVPPFYDTDMQSIKQTLKKTLEHKIAWLEIEKQGSRYNIS